MGGQRLLDIGDRRRGVAAGGVDHGHDARPLDPGWTLLWADVVWASNHQDRSAARTPRTPEGTHAALDGFGHLHDSQLQVVCHRPAGASAHCSRVFGFGWYEWRAMGRRKVSVQGRVGEVMLDGVVH
jgi:hypothetical protein